MSLSSQGTVIVDAVGVALIGLLTAVPVSARSRRQFFGRSQSQSFNEKTYGDKDGSASDQSERAFSTRIPCLVLYLCTLCGVCFSFAWAVLTSAHASENQRSTAVPWIQFGSWVFVACQAVHIYCEKRPVKRHNLALLDAISHFILFVLVSIEGIHYVHRAAADGTSTATLALAAAVLAVSLVGFAASIRVPRRPDVFRYGKAVDRQWNVSFFDRMTYSWGSPLLRIAKARGELSLKDLPMMDHYTRAEDLHTSFTSEKRTGSLMKKLLLAHRSAIIRQHIATFFQSLLQVAPQFAMYNLLKVMEARNTSSAAVSSALWVVGLGLAVLVREWIENWMWWISYALVQVPIRVQLAALVFGKSLRRKDVKGAKKADKDPSKADGGSGSVKSVDTGKSSESGDPLEDTEQKTRQGTINLVGVDAQRIADFTTYMNLFGGSIIKLIAVFAFLGSIIGWQALCAGVFAQLLTMPLNYWAAKRYTKKGLELMSIRDQKLVVLNEALSGIRQIKFSALENQWTAKIRAVRDQELRTVWSIFCYDSVLIWLWIVGPVMLSAVSLAVYAVVHGSLSPSVAFTTIATLTEIEGTLSFVPEIITSGIDAYVSLGRIDKYVNSPEKTPNTTPGDSISFEAATIAWASDDEVDTDAFVLHDLTLEFPVGELSVISGRTGTGKSLILTAILGEAEVLSGRVTVPHAPGSEQRHDAKANKSNWIIPSVVAYVSQQPWIENCTFKENVLFGLPFDEERYRQVIFACALEKDLAMLTDGEKTEIGANGINLSGGQRWRITLARALYSRAGILILDDVLSAIDAHVGRHIFENALTGDLAHRRTRILVTHHVSLCLPKIKYHVRLGDGCIETAGLVEDLERTGHMQHIIEAEENEEAVEDDEASELPGLQKITSRSSHQGQREAGSPSIHRKRTNSILSSTSRRLSIASAAAGTSHAEGSDAVMSAQKQPRKYVEEETKERGRVKWRIYDKYLRTAGSAYYWSLVTVLFIGFQAIILGRNWWVAVWTDSYETQSAPANHATKLYHSLQTWNSAVESGVDNRDLWFYLSIYVGFSVGVVFEGVWRYFTVYWGSIRASRRLFESLTHAVLRAPLRWLDTVPQGRILNRFTADFNKADLDLPTCVAFLFFNAVMLIGIIVAGVIVSPYIVIVALVLLLICTRYAIYYLEGAREAKRLESILKSPIFDLFGTTLSGISTIRAFDKTAEYERQMFSKIDANATAFYHMWLFNRWLTWRLGLVGVVFVTVMATIVVSIDSIGASLGGFALGFTLQYSEATVWMLRNYSMMELGMNAIERIVEYAEIPTEDEGGADAPAAWPSEGRLEVDGLSVGYAPDLPAVLKEVSFRVERNERVGVVGRTGAGKSSLTLALFRFLEAREGSVYIDGLDISTIKLHDLRGRLAIIPQDPVLFSGTVRSNLDPFHDHGDRELEEALDRVHLRSSQHADGVSAADAAMANINIFDSLGSPISEGGSNLSQGQRQLLCLARAIVARPKIMVLDEATSAVDKATDTLIQRSIRDEFTGSTLLVIAHRLSTIADFDRILVMSEGRVVEYDTPRALMEKEDSEFRGMVEDSGEKETLREVIYGG